MSKTGTCTSNYDNDKSKLLYIIIPSKQLHICFLIIRKITIKMMTILYVSFCLGLGSMQTLNPDI